MGLMDCMSPMPSTVNDPSRLAALVVHGFAKGNQ